MTTQIERRDQLVRRLNIPRSSLFKLQKTDPTFPKPVKLGARAVGWISSEVDEWLLSRKRV